MAGSSITLDWKEPRTLAFYSGLLSPARCRVQSICLSEMKPRRRTLWTGRPQSSQTRTEIGPQSRLSLSHYTRISASFFSFHIDILKDGRFHSDKILGATR
jgi:hypothetical protein